MTDFENVKSRYTIADAWRDLALPGDPAKSCRCPWRDDRKASLSVYDDGRRWKDFSTGESGDVGDFVSKATGWSAKDSLQWCRERAAINFEAEYRPRADQPHNNGGTKKALVLPPHSPGDPTLWKTLADLRKISVPAIEHAANLGVLVFGQVCGSPCWILHEPGVIAEARRLDGQPFSAIGKLSERKAHTLAGSRKDWPIGTRLLTGTSGPVVVVEGGPDWLAALHFILEFERTDVLPVAMMGRTNHISPAALPFFEGRRVRILPHCDPDGGGLEAARRWGQQLREIAGPVDGFVLDGLSQADNSQVSDLNDAVLIKAEERAKLEGILP